MSLEIFRSTVPSLTTLGSSPTRLSRQAHREVAVIESNLAVRQTAVDAAAEIQKAKIDALTSTGGYAMQRAALVGQMEQQLALACPTSSGDLDFLKTITMVGIGQVLSDTASKVNRL